MVDFHQRSNTKEIMDNLDFEGPVLDQTLKELKTINQLLGGNAVTTKALQKVISNTSQPTFTIADIGCGRGDMIEVMALWAQKKGLNCHFIGIDANPHTIEIGKKTLSELKNVSFKTANVFDEEFLTEPVDISTCTLFTHHFTDEELVRIFKSIKSKTTLAFIINDLHRHPMAYYSIRLLTKYFSKSFMVKNDGPLSVLRSFKKYEIVQLLKKAGFEHVQIQWNWAFRWQIICKCS
jgi:2-polyprenyl-3-methyl-5-hydroxy-6-metoxy-1,4-benzoquinol methylase